MSRNERIKPTCEYCGGLSSNFRLHECRSYPQLQVCWACKQWEDKNFDKTLSERKKRKKLSDSGIATRKKRKIRTSSDTESESEDDATLAYVGKKHRPHGKKRLTLPKRTSISRTTPIIRRRMQPHPHSPPKKSTNSTNAKTDFTKHAEKTTIPKKMTQASTTPKAKNEKKSKELDKAISIFQNVTEDFKKMEVENSDLHIKYKKYKSGMKKKMEQNDILTKQILHMESQKKEHQKKIEALKKENELEKRDKEKILVENENDKKEIKRLKERTKHFEAVKKDNKTIYDSVVNDMIQGTADCNQCRQKDHEIFEWENKYIDKKNGYEKILSEKKNLEKEFETVKAENRRNDYTIRNLKHEVELKEQTLEKLKQNEIEQRKEIFQIRTELEKIKREKERFGRLESIAELPRDQNLNYQRIGRNVDESQGNRNQRRDPYRPPPRPHYDDRFRHGRR